MLLLCYVFIFICDDMQGYVYNCMHVGTYLRMYIL